MPEHDEIELPCILLKKRYLRIYERRSRGQIVPQVRQHTGRGRLLCDNREQQTRFSFRERGGLEQFNEFR